MRKIFGVSLALLFASTVSLLAQDDAPPPDVRQKTAAKTFAAKGKVIAPKPDAVKAVPLTPLSDRERAVQMLDRFTFGAHPGDADHVMTVGVDKWFEQQLNPDTIKDPALDRRLADFPTLTMTPEQALTVFPDRGTIQRVADGKQPMPADPVLAAMYEVQIAKLRKEADARRVDAAGNPLAEPSDAEKAADKQQGQITASRIAGELFALPKNQRMAALIVMPVEDRIAFTGSVGGDQKNLLLADFSPREREIFLGMAAGVGAQYQIGQELAQAKMVRAILSERQLQEVMTDFWFNHFNIYIGKDSDQFYTTSYERDAIRKNALGKFSDLLLATAQSPAMMVYLDNWLSIGPDSLANGVNPANPRSKPGNKGLNENYGREIMELHTVGVNGGYTQSDVTNLAAILTGWTVNQPNQAGAFQFDPKRHEPGAKVWLGHKIGSGQTFVPQGGSAISAELAARTAPAMNDSMDEMMMGGGTEQKAAALANAPGNAGMKEGLEALNLLAHSPQTAHFISWKIAQRFVADDPPPALVDRMAKTFLASDGDIKAVLRTLVASPEFNSKKYFRNKVKTPMEFLASAYRTTLTDPSNPGALVNTIRTMGMPLYFALPPTGYYITADHWMNSSALVDRLNFAYQLTNGKFANQKFDAPKVVALGLLSESSQAQIASATAMRPAVPKYAVTWTVPAAAAPPVTPSGPEIALKVLESTLIGGDVSSQSNELIHKQIVDASLQNTGPGDMLNLLTALVMGSPEFQLR
ncbi:MAG: DUF1800 domain-containing protein [Acidobacteriota bacterium]|nr:DUF1800 domain-containing protein [Acidobacteriota bacterium]